MSKQTESSVPSYILTGLEEKGWRNVAQMEILHNADSF